MTVRAALLDAVSRLSEIDISTPHLDAEVLMGFVLGVTRAALLADPMRHLTASQAAQYRELVARRRMHEPVAYLTGSRVWRDLAVHVTPAVLIPRPETERLVDMVLAWAHGHPVRTIAEIGTGSGVIGITLARALPDVHIDAVDVSASALEVARENARRLVDTGNLTLCQGDLLEGLEGPYDSIVANLPYVSAEEYRALSPDVACYEPRDALVGGESGSELIVRLIETASTRLAAPGALYAEVGPPQGETAALVAARSFPDACVSLLADDAGLVRYIAIERDS